ncbi:MAG: Fe-S cluster assembly protein SufD, partial [Leptolyngbya sp. SIO4C5]|nr:Fe-S cluster assembly protein SufD [Leptolyngbya sp. SIO4C5]
MTQVTKRETYLNQLIDAVTAETAAKLPLPQLRQTARALVQEQTFPSTRDEEWRFSDLSEMLTLDFQRAKLPSEKELAAIAPPLSETENSRLVFVNGLYVESLSARSALPDEVVVGNLAGHTPRPDL